MRTKIKTNKKRNFSYSFPRVEIAGGAAAHEYETGMMRERRLMSLFCFVDLFRFVQIGTMCALRRRRRRRMMLMMLMYLAQRSITC